MKFILGKKIEMTQKFAADGNVTPVTIVKAGPCFVTQVKNIDKDGYKSVQVGFEAAKKVNKPLAGHLKKSVKAKFLREFLIEKDDTNTYELGQQITANVFVPGEKIKVTGISKGKGFQGVVRRHGFHGHNETHGTKDSVRMPGSIGAGGPQHVFKGKRMAGRMGGDTVSVTNLQVIEVDAKNNLIYVKGAIPGSRNGLVALSADGVMELSQKIEPNVTEAPQEEVKAEQPAAEAAVEAKAETDDKAEAKSEK